MLRYRPNSNAFAVRALLFVIAITLASFMSLGEGYSAFAQIPPLFPPPPAGSSSGAAVVNDANPIKDTASPKIQLQTTELRPGKNVIVVQVVDDSYLPTRQVKFVEDGRIRFTDLARDHGDTYHALIDVQPPRSVLVIEAIDAAGNRSVVTEELPVKGGSYEDDFWGLVTLLWKNVISFVGLDEIWK